MDYKPPYILRSGIDISGISIDLSQCERTIGILVSVNEP